MQLRMDILRDAWDVHVIERDPSDDDTPPRLRHYRDVSRASVVRFYTLSGGMRTAYGTKDAMR